MADKPKIIFSGNPTNSKYINASLRSSEQSNWLWLWLFDEWPDVVPSGSDNGTPALLEANFDKYLEEPESDCEFRNPWHTHAVPPEHVPMLKAWARGEAPHCELYDYLEERWPECPPGFIDGLTQLVLQDQQEAAEGHLCPTKST